MSTLPERIKTFFAPLRPLSAGVHHYQSPPEDPRNYRLHLRIEPDGSGLLIVNAATILHLNTSATELAYHLVNNTAADEAARQMARRYHVDIAQARQDYIDLSARIQSLVNTPDLDPIAFLDFERKSPHSGAVSAPYRLDCALTYRQQAGVDPQVAPQERVRRELTAAEWEQVFDRAWQAGIPHLIFTGGEPTLRDDLPQLIAHAEANGQVTGLLSDGLRLADPAYFNILLQTGLDHLVLLFDETRPEVWKALENIQAADLYYTIHLTLDGRGLADLLALMEKLAGMGVPAVSLSAAEVGLGEALLQARRRAAELGLELVWNLPVPYSRFHPLAVELAGHETIPDGAGKAWLYVEPDGDVLPAAGVNKVMGNLLSDPWEKIWKG
jgi:hypothetical protein